MNKKYVLLFLSLVFLFSFVVLSKYEDRSFIRNLDFAVTVKIQEKIDSSTHLRIASFIDNSMTGATFFASPEFTSVVVILLTGWLLYDFKKPTFVKTSVGKKKYWLVLIIPIAFVAIVSIEIFAKSIVHHPSPPFSMIKHATSIFPANYINEQFSYPSGHAARAVFLSIITYSLFFIHTSLIFRKKWNSIVVVGLIGYVMLAGLSRVYLGHHWFSDVVGGAFLACSLAFGVLSFAPVDGWDKADYNRKVHE